MSGKNLPPEFAERQLRFMQRYSDFIDRLLLNEDLLLRLLPSEPYDRELLRRVQGADDASITGGRAIGVPAMFALVRAGLFYALDALEECHSICQQATNDEGSYWHGMVHRREGDFDNARYWFRRAGSLSLFGAMHHAAAQHSTTMSRQPTWDAYLLTGQCEQARFGAEELTPELVKLQQVEFEVLFEYCWQRSAVT